MKIKSLFLIFTSILALHYKVTGMTNINDNTGTPNSGKRKRDPICTAFSNGFSAFHDTIVQNHTEIIKLLLKNGMPANSFIDNNGNTMLHTAARHNRVDIIKTLIESGAYIDAFNNENQTPLYQATHVGYEESVKLLLRRGASLIYSDNEGWTPLHRALFLCNSRITVRLLLESCLRENYSSLINSPLQPLVLESHQTTSHQSGVAKLRKLFTTCQNKGLFPLAEDKFKKLNFRLLVEIIPFGLQQYMAFRWKMRGTLESMRNYHNLLTANCMRHLKLIQTLLLMKNNRGFTPFNLARLNNTPTFMLINHIASVRFFKDLDPSLQRYIRNSLKKHLDLHPNLKYQAITI